MQKNKVMITGNEPAMPSSVCCNEQGIYKGSDAPSSVGGNGLTKREYFAARAMQGMASSAYWSENFVDYEPDLKKVMEIAVKAADALIAELNKQ